MHLHHWRHQGCPARNRPFGPAPAPTINDSQVKTKVVQCALEVLYGAYAPRPHHHTPSPPSCVLPTICCTLTLIMSSRKTFPQFPHFPHTIHHTCPHKFRTHRPITGYMRNPCWAGRPGATLSREVTQNPGQGAGYARPGYGLARKVRHLLSGEPGREQAQQGIREKAGSGFRWSNHPETEGPLPCGRSVPPSLREARQEGNALWRITFCVPPVRPAQATPYLHEAL